MDSLGTKSLEFLPRLALGLGMLWGGFFLVRLIVSMLERALDWRHMEPTVEGFLLSFLSIVMRILVLLFVASIMGLPTTTFVAVIGAATLAIGMSLQGSLSNMAGGILILFFKPFRVGDTVEAQAQKGKVVRIEILYTRIRGEDGRMIIIPNAQLSNGVVINHSSAIPPAPAVARTEMKRPAMPVGSGKTR